MYAYRGTAPTESRAPMSCMHFGVGRQRPQSPNDEGHFSIGPQPHTARPASYSTRLLLSEGTVLLSGMLTKEASVRLWVIPIPRPRRRAWGRGKEWNLEVDVSVLGDTLFFLSLHSHTAQQGRNVHVDVHVSPLLAAAHLRFYDIAHILGQRQQCSGRSAKHRENRRSAGYITRSRQPRRSSSQAQGRHTIPLHHVRTLRRQRPRGSCFGFGHCASPEQRHFLSRLLC